MRLFRKKSTAAASEVESDNTPEPKQRSQRATWLRVSIIANIVILLMVIGVATSGAIIHQSNTNPNFCAVCHIMQPNVNSYHTSNHLDNVHFQAGVECKGCHEYPLDAEIEAGIAFITGNYYVTADGTLPKHEYGDEMCLDCHISREHLANQTDFLEYNPHLHHQGEMMCRDCHASHGEQIDACSECHTNGGQRMVEGPIIPRAENPWASENEEFEANEESDESASLFEAIDAELNN